MHRLAALALGSLVVVNACGSQRPVEEHARAAGVTSGLSATTPSPGKAPPGADERNGRAGGHIDEPGASGNHETTADGRPRPATTEVGEGTPVRIGVVGTMSGPAGGSLKPVVDGVQIWARSANQHGGVNGHRVEVVTGDDRGDPTLHRQLVQQFVEEKDVFAFVGNPEALTGGPSVEYLQRVKVPVVGSDSGGDYFYTSPVHFPQMPHGQLTVESGFRAFAEMAKADGHTRFGVVACVEAEVCQTSLETYSRLAPKLGVRIAYKASASFAQPDYTAECLAAQSADVEVMIPVLDAGSMGRMGASCARQGFRPTFASNEGIVTDATRTDPNLQGMYVSTSVAPWFLRSNAAVAEFHRDVRVFGGGAIPTAPAYNGWLAGKLFARAAASLPEPPTRQALFDTLHDVKADDLHGATVPLTFGAGVPARTAMCWWNNELVGKAWRSVDGGRRHCL